MQHGTMPRPLTLDLQPIRTLIRVEAAIPDDPDWKTLGAPDDSFCWHVRGATNRVVVYLGLFTSAGVRVTGGTATIEPMTWNPATVYGLPDTAPDAWHSLGISDAGTTLDEPYVIDVGRTLKMAVRLTSIGNIGTATELRMSAQRMSL